MNENTFNTAHQYDSGQKLLTAIVIPAYNEDAALGQTIHTYQKAFPEACVIVVDNNSSDNTHAVAQAELRDGVDFLLTEYRQGKGYAVKRGISRIPADIYIMTDGDMTYPAEDARLLYDKMLATRSDMIVGDRRAGGTYEGQNKRFGHSFGNGLLTKVISQLAGQEYNDVLSGLRVMSRPFVQALDVRSSGFQLETEINIVAAHMRADVLEEPIRYDARPDGSESKLSTIKDGMRILSFAALNWIAFLPMQFFSILSGFCVLFASFLGYRVVSGFLETGWPYTTTAIAAATCGIVAILSIFTGLSLRIQGRAERRREVAAFLERKRNWNAKLDTANF